MGPCRVGTEVWDGPKRRSEWPTSSATSLLGTCQSSVEAVQLRSSRYLLEIPHVQSGESDGVEDKILQGVRFKQSVSSSVSRLVNTV